MKIYQNLFHPPPEAAKDRRSARASAVSLPTGADKITLGPEALEASGRMRSVGRGELNRLWDADDARVRMVFARGQIITQSGRAMLAQANTPASTAQRLLG